MSRIGKLPVEIPAGVEIKVSGENVVSVKGKLGELSQPVDSAIEVKLEDRSLTLVRTNESKDTRSKH